MADLSLTWIDTVFLVLVGASTLLAVFRGLVQEVYALVLWIAAFVAAGSLAVYAAELMPEGLGAGVQHGLGFGAVFFLVLLLGQWVGQALSLLTQAIGLSWLNRVLGAVFGFGRGVFVSGLLALVGAATSLPSDLAWQEARVRPVLERTVALLVPWAPGFIAARIPLVS
jgi:membrane protein required for colicin V production